MKFYFFTKGNKNVPSSRYRAYYIAEELEQLGYETVVIPATETSLRGFLKYLRIMLKIGSKDVLYLQRTVYNKYFLVALLLAYICGKRFIFDIDDAVYEHSFLKTKILTRHAKFVTCGSSKIRDWTVQHNKRSYVLTNSVPLKIYTPREKEPEGTPIIGWIGTMPELFMKPAIPALRQLAKNGVQFKLKVIGAMGNEEIRTLLSDIPDVTIIDSLNWSDPSEAVREIKSFTIGIMPLRSDEWDQVKYFKALEYMACCVPVVATATETVRDIVEKHHCGVVVNTTDEWVKQLSKLLNDWSLRAEMGRNGRLAIEKEYSMRAVTQQLLDLMSTSESDYRK